MRKVPSEKQEIRKKRISSGDPLLVGFPCPLPVSFRFPDGIARVDDAAPDNHYVAAHQPDDFLRRVVLLSHPVSLDVRVVVPILGRQLAARGHAQKRIVLPRVQALLRDKPHHEVPVLPRALHTGIRVLLGHEVARRAHLRQDQQSPIHGRLLYAVQHVVPIREALVRARRVCRLEVLRDGRHRHNARLASRVGDGILQVLLGNRRHRRIVAIVVRFHAAVPRRAHRDVRLDQVPLALLPPYGRVGEGVDGGLAGHHVHVRDVRPLDDLGGALGVLQLHRVADVAELAVLEDEEAVLAGEARQARPRTRRRVVVPVRDKVVVRLEDDDRGPDGAGEAEELVGGGDVGAEAEVGAFQRHEAKEVGGERVLSGFSSLAVGGFGDMMGGFAGHVWC